MKNLSCFLFILFVFCCCSVGSFAENLGSFKILADFEGNTNYYTYQRVVSIDSKNLMGIGISPYFVGKSTDGGLTWNPVYINANAYQNTLRDIAYVSPTTAFVTGDSGKIIRTTDGGLTWKRLRPETIHPCDKIKMLDSFNGIVVALPDTLLKTTDGGETWDIVQIPDSIKPQKSIYWELLYPERNVFAISAIGQSDNWFLKTTDDGKTWEKYLMPYTASSLTMSEKDHYWYVSPKPTGKGQEQYDIIVESTDGGKTWDTPVFGTYGVIDGLSCIVFRDRLEGMALSAYDIFYTVDGGQSWHKSDLSNDPPEYPHARWWTAFVGKGKAIITATQRVYEFDSWFTGVNEENKTEEPIFTLSSNIVKDEEPIVLRINENNGPGVLTVSDNMGKLISNKQTFGQNVVTIPTGNMPSGMYFIEYKVKNLIEVKKVLIIK